MQRPKVSIITPCYNAEAFLAETMDSVLKQTLLDIEFICVDDCSTDKTWEILSKYADNDSRVRIFKTSKNSGFAAIPANLGLAQSRGEYVLFIGHDDMLGPDTLEKCYLRAIETGADAVFPSTVAFNDETKKVVRRKIGLDGDITKTLTNREAVILSLDWSLPGSGFWRGDMVRRLKLCELGMNGDEFSQREFLYNSNKVVFCDGEYLYRLHSKSITHKASDKVLDIFIIHKRLLSFLIEQKFTDDILIKYQKLILISYKFVYMGRLLRKCKKADYLHKQLFFKKMRQIFLELDLRKLSRNSAFVDRFMFRSYIIFRYVAPADWFLRLLLIRGPRYILRRIIPCSGR